MVAFCLVSRSWLLPLPPCLCLLLRTRMVALKPHSAIPRAACAAALARRCCGCCGCCGCCCALFSASRTGTAERGTPRSCGLPGTPMEAAGPGREDNPIAPTSRRRRCLDSHAHQPTPPAIVSRCAGTRVLFRCVLNLIFLGIRRPLPLHATPDQEDSPERDQDEHTEVSAHWPPDGQSKPER